MKEKNKKILKGIGVGALACVGVLGLTGCSQIEISQNTVDSMIETVEKTDTRLDEYITLLEQQNQQLQDQNEKLEDLLNEANELTKEEILNLCNIAYYNSYFQTNGYENVEMTGISGIYNVQWSFYTNEAISIMCYIENLNEFNVVYFDNASKKIVTATFSETNGEYTCIDKYTSTDPSNTKYSMGESAHPAGCFDLLEKENLKTYERLENGNYSLLFVTETNEYYEEGEEKPFTRTLYATIELTQEGKMVSYSAETVLDLDFDCDQETWEDLSHSNIAKGAITYSYGTVDVELMETLYELAQAAEETERE